MKNNINALDSFQEVWSLFGKIVSVFGKQVVLSKTIWGILEKPLKSPWN